MISLEAPRTNEFQKPITSGEQSSDHQFVLVADPKASELAIKVGRELGQHVWPGLLEDHTDEELYPKLGTSVRGKNVYIISSPSYPNLHRNICATTLMTRTAFDSDAKEVNVVIPYFPYQRADKKDEPRTAIGGKLMADFLEVAGANRIVTVELHNLALQSAVNKAKWISLFASWSMMPELESLGINGKVVVASPDAGGLKRARWFRNYLREKSNMNVQPDVPAADKYRELGDGDNSKSTLSEANYRGSTVIIFDDILSSGGTIANPARDFKSMGAEAVIGVVPHALWTRDLQKGTYSIDTIRNSSLDLLLVTDSVRQPKEALNLKNVREVSIAPMLAGVVKCIEYHVPVSEMFLKASFREKILEPLYDPNKEDYSIQLPE